MNGFASSLGVALMLAGQASAPQQDVDTGTTAIVHELRALRQTIETVLASNVRVQLLMGRLQLQEARIEALARQNASIDAQLSSMTAERQAFERQGRTLERVASTVTDPREREAAEQELAALAERVKTIESRHAALLVEQANVQQLVATEQNRWSDFNQRLEELERALALPRR